MAGKIILGILGVLLLLLAVILLTPAGVRFRYDRGDLSLLVRFGPLKLQIFPRKEKKPPRRKPEETKEEPEKKQTGKNRRMIRKRSRRRRERRRSLNRRKKRKKSRGQRSTGNRFSTAWRLCPPFWAGL